MRHWSLSVVLFAAAAAACTRTDRDAAKPSQRQPEWLADVPVLPRSLIYDVSSTGEAQHRGMRLAWPMDSVAAYYRSTLPAQGWRLVSDVGDTAGVSLYLQKGERSLWVQVRRSGPASSDYRFTATSRPAGEPAAGPRR